MASDTLWVRVVVDGLHGLRKLELNVIAVNQALSLLSALFSRLTAVPLSILETTDAFRKLTVMLTHTEGSAEAAAARIDKLRAMVQKVGVPLQELAKVAAQFQAAGLQDVDRTIKALADAVAAFGGGRQDFELAALAIQQMAGKGVISMEELRRQLGERIPTAIRIMARELGISVAELYKQVKSGQMEAFGAIEALTRGLEADYGGTTERLTNTWERAMLDMKDAWQQFARAVGESGFADDVMSDIRGLATLMRAITPEVVPPAVRRVELLEQQRESLEEQLKTTGLKPGGIASFRGIFDRLINANLNIEDVEKELADVNKQLQYTKVELQQYYEAWEDHNIDLTKLAKKDIGVDVQKAIDAFNAKHPLKSLLAYAIELDAAFQKEQKSGLSEMNLLAQRQADTMNERMRAAEREGMEYETLRDRLEPLRAKAIHDAEGVALHLIQMMEDVDLALEGATTGSGVKKPIVPGTRTKKAATVSGSGIVQNLAAVLAQTLGFTGETTGGFGGGLVGFAQGGLSGAFQGMGMGAAAAGAMGGGLGMAAQLIWAAMQENPALKAAMDRLWKTLVDVVAPLAEALVPALDALGTALRNLKPVFTILAHALEAFGGPLAALLTFYLGTWVALTTAQIVTTAANTAATIADLFATIGQTIAEWFNTAALHLNTSMQGAGLGALVVAITLLIAAIEKLARDTPSGQGINSWVPAIEEGLETLGSNLGFAHGGRVTAQRMLGFNPVTGGGLIYAHEGERVVPRSGGGGDTFNITLVNPDTNELARQIEYLVRTRRLAL